MAYLLCEEYGICWILTSTGVAILVSRADHVIVNVYARGGEELVVLGLAHRSTHLLHSSRVKHVRGNGVWSLKT